MLSGKNNQWTLFDVSRGSGRSLRHEAAMDSDEHANNNGEEAGGRGLEQAAVVAAIRGRDRRGHIARHANGGGRLREGDEYGMT